MAELSLEEYARILAHVAHFKGANDEEVRERLGIDGAAWRNAERIWPTRVAEQLRSSDTTLSRELARVFLATKARLQAEQPALEAIGPTLAERNAAAPPRAGSVDETAFSAVQSRCATRRSTQARHHAGSEWRDA
jgi:hypothetical protein